MFTKTKMTLCAAILLGTAFSASAATRPHHVPLNQQFSGQSARQTALDAFAMVPRGQAGSVDDPAATGGGSAGYNETLRANQW